MCQLLCGNKLLLHSFLILSLNATQDLRNPEALVICTCSSYTNVLIKGKTHADNPQTPVESLFQLSCKQNQTCIPTELKSIEQAMKKKTYSVL